MTESLRAAAQWLNLHDSAFPAGRLVHSNGIESWLHAFPDAGAERIIELVIDYVTASVATLDAVVGAHAWATDDAGQLAGLDELLLSYKTSENARTASLEPGRRLAQTVRRVAMPCGADEYLNAVIAEQAAGNIAVVESVVQAGIGIDHPTAIMGSLRSAMSSAFSACVRLGRLGSIGAQRALVASTPDLAKLVDVVIATPLDEVTNNTFELEVFGMRHRLMSPRLFAS